MFVKNSIYPLYAKYKGARFLSYYYELEKSQWFTEDRIKEIQWQKLKNLLNHSFKNVPYYKNIFQLF